MQSQNCSRARAKSFRSREFSNVIFYWRRLKIGCIKILPALHRAGLSYIPTVQQLLKKILAILAALVVLFAVICIGFIAGRWIKPTSSQHFMSTTTVVKQVQTLSELVTVKYVMEKVVVLQDTKWYGENRVLLLAHGVVKAGIDLKDISPGDVMISGKKINIHLPPPQITDAYLDDKLTQVIDHTTGLLRTYDKDLEQIARQNAVDDIQRAARNSGILKDADERAKLELALFLHQAGFEQVEFDNQSPVPVFTNEGALKLDN